MATHTEPDFATWLAVQMESRGLTQAALARCTTIPKATVTTFLSRRTRRPSIEVAQRLARGLEWPTMAMAVVTGYADRQGLGESEEAVWVTTMPWIGGMEPAQRSISWSRLGRAVVVAGLLKNQANREVAWARWESRGVRGPNAEDDVLGTDRRMGAVGGIGLLDAMGGAELALMVEGAGGTPSDVIATAAVMGRIGPGLCRSWGCESDWGVWAEAAGPMLRASEGDIERFDAHAYLESCRRVSWSSPPLEAEEGAGINPASYGAPDLVSLWPRLTSVQKDVVRGLLRSWNLS